MKPWEQYPVWWLGGGWGIFHIPLPAKVTAWKLGASLQGPMAGHYLFHRTGRAIVYRLVPSRFSLYAPIHPSERYACRCPN